MRKRRSPPAGSAARRLQRASGLGLARGGGADVSTADGSAPRPAGLVRLLPVRVRGLRRDPRGVRAHDHLPARLRSAGPGDGAVQPRGGGPPSLRARRARGVRDRGRDPRPLGASRPAAVAVPIAGLLALLLFGVVDLPKANDVGSISGVCTLADQGIDAKAVPEAGFWLEMVGAVALTLSGAALAMLHCGPACGPGGAQRWLGGSARRRQALGRGEASGSGQRPARTRRGVGYQR